MSSSRITGLFGLAFAVLFTAGLVLPTYPGGEDGEADVLRWLESDSNRVQAVIGTYVMCLGAIAFLAFISGIGGRLTERGANPAGISFVRLSGSLFAGLVLVAAAILGTPAITVEFTSDAPALDESLVRTMWAGTVVLLLPAFLAAAASVATASYLALRSSALPGWVCWLGFLCAVLMLNAVVFLPALALPIWVVCTSVVLLLPAAARSSNSALAPSHS